MIEINRCKICNEFFMGITYYRKHVNQGEITLEEYDIILKEFQEKNKKNKIKKKK